MDAAVLALCDLAADRLGVIDLAAIGPEVEPAGIRILSYHAVTGADETRRILLVMFGHGEFQNVDGIAFENILQDRTVIDPARRHRLELAHPLVIGFDDVDLAV